MDVVEDEEALREQQAGIGQANVVGGAHRQSLEGARHVVPDVADGAAREARHARHGNGAVLSQQRLQGAERIRGDLAHRPPPRRLHLDGLTARAEYAGGLGPEEAVPAPLLPPLDALQEEAVRAAMDLQERRDGRLEVGENLTADRDQVPVSGQLAKVRAARGDGRGAQRRRPPFRPRRGPHSDATKACSTPSCSRSRCIAAVAWSAFG